MDKYNVPSIVTSLSSSEIQSLVRQAFTTNTDWDYTSRWMNSKDLFMTIEKTFDVDSFQITELDSEIGAKRKVEGSNAAKVGVVTGYSKQIFRNTIAIEREITWEAWEGFTAKGLQDFVSDVKRDLDYKILLDMTCVLSFGQQTEFVDNGGFTVDISGGDGQAPFANHTLKYSPLTYNNFSQSQLTQASFETAYNYFTYKLYDNLGVNISGEPNTLIVSYDLRMIDRAKMLLGSSSTTAAYDATGAPINANTNAGIKNPINDAMKMKSIKFDIDVNGMTDTTKSLWWFMAQLSQNTKTTLQWFFAYWRRATINPMEWDSSSLKNSFTGYAAYAIGTSNSKRIYGNFPTA